MSSLDLSHYRHLKESAIDDDIIDLNFRSWNPHNENDLDDIFTLLIADPSHRNNGTLKGKSQNDLANAIRSGGWVFEGRMGASIKLNDSRKDKDGKKIKYESPRGAGNQQLFVPKVSVRIALEIAEKISIIRSLDSIEPADEDKTFWDWFIDTDLPLIITEGCKKAASLVSAGYPAIALNGVYGWGTNDRDVFGNVEKDDRNQNIKTLNPDLNRFISNREVILAFDFDINPSTVEYVAKAKKQFIHKIFDIADKISELKWSASKGIDDLIVAKGVKTLARIYGKRTLFKFEEEKKKQPTAWELAPGVVADVFGDTTRYDVEFKQYWEYRCGLWVQCADEYIFALVKTYLDTVTENYSTRLVGDAITFARGSILVPEWIEADNTKFIPFINGVLEVETMQLLGHDPSYGFRWQMPRDYSVVSTGWSSIDRFLNEFSNQNVELKNILLAFCNATLMGRSNLHKFLYLSGSGGNGKGVFMNLLKAMVGESNTCTTSLASLNDNRFEPANIKNKRLVLCADEDKKPESLTVFKSATGGDNIACEYKGKQSVNFRFGGIFVVAANQPIFRGENHEAMKRRKVDFPCLFKPVTKDDDLLDRLILDLPSFTTYVLSLDPDWVKKTIKESGTVEAISELAREMSIREDSIAAYFDGRLVVDTSESIQSEPLYKDYQSFCDSNGLKSMSSVQFTPKLIELCATSMGFNVFKKKGKTGIRIHGLRFRSALDSDTEEGEGSVKGGEGYPSPIEPLLRADGAGVKGKTPYSYVCEKKKINKKNIDLNTEGVKGFYPSPPSPKDMKVPASNTSSVVKGTKDGEGYPSPSPGDRVYVPNSGKYGRLDRIDRRADRPLSPELYARVIMEDDGSERWILPENILKAD